ncbi:MAG: YkgJ family cysteine cluster protein [Planctomycetaceae bacterium]|nr:YkgJ family cysteine cluster protein [Planctomycetales bacterium]MCB9923515.1 YkgJ family cysteine cluster protein [Planctomycetaceae bacterium]
MSVPIKTLPILERWECASCGNCCRGSVIPLSDADMERLKQQRWEEHPDFESVRTVTNRGWFDKRAQLAQRPDGSCVFLTPDNRCRIHAEFGEAAKPLVCQMYPLQLVPQEKRVILTLRRSCPSAAADRGAELQKRLSHVTQLAERGRLLDIAIRAPSITRRYRGSWTEALTVARAIERLLVDERFPLVRRLVHGVRFCDLVEQCKWRRLVEKQLPELMTLLEDACHQDVSDLFAKRQPPQGAVATLFRQAAAEYLRLHSSYRVTDSWHERWRLARAALAIARGRGRAPLLHPSFPEVTFEALEEPLGHLTPEVQRPFVRLYEANARSLQYVVAARPGWSIVESFRAFALAYPVALWIMRWSANNRSPTNEDAIEMVTIMDRGQGHEPLAGSQHRRRVATIARTSQLEKMIVWYAQ